MDLLGTATEIENKLKEKNLLTDVLAQAFVLLTILEMFSLNIQKQ